MRFFRICLFILIGVMLVIVAIGVALTQVDIGRFSDDITQGIEEATGRAFKIGQIRREGIFRPQIAIDDIRLGSIEGTTEPNFLYVRQARAEVDLLSLLGGSIDVRTLHLDTVRVVFDRNKEGVPNWRFPKNDPDAKPLFIPDFLVDHVSIKNFLFVRKLRNGREFTFNVNDGLVDFNQITDQAEVVAVGLVGEAGVTATGLIEHVSHILRGGHAPASFDLQSEGAVGTMRGFIVRPASGRASEFDLKLSNAKTLTVKRMLKLPMPVIRSVDGQGKLTIRGSEVALDDLVLTADEPAAKGSLRGRVGDMKRIAGIDVVLDVDDGNFIEVFPAFNTRLPDMMSVHGRTRFVGNRQEIAAQEFDFTFNYQDVSIVAKGAIGDLRDVSGIDLVVSGNAQNLTSVGPLIRRELPEFGPLEGAARVHGGRQALSITDMDILLDDPRMTGSIRGQVLDVLTPTGVSIVLDLQSKTIAPLEKWFDVKFPGPGTMAMTGTMTDVENEWHLTLDSGKLRSVGIAIDVAGTVSDIEAGRGIDLTIEATAQDLSQLNGLTSNELPALENGFLDARLTGEKGDLDLLINRVSVEDPRFTLNGSGQIETLGLGARPEIMLQASSTNTLPLWRLFNVDFPDLGEVSMNGRLVRANKDYVLEKIEGGATSAGFNAKVTGHINDLSNFAGVDLVIELDADDTTAIPATSSSWLKSVPWVANLGEITGHAVLSGNAERFEVPSLKIQTTKDDLIVNINAVIPDVRQWKASDYEVDVTSNTLADVGAILNRDLPPFGPFKANAKVTGASKGWNVKDLEISVKDTDIDVSINGQIPDTEKLDELALDLKLDSNSLRQLSELIDLDFEHDVPVDGSAKIKRQGDKFVIDDIKVDVAGSNIEGNLLVEGFAASNGTSKVVQKRIVGNIFSDRLDLKPLFPETDDLVSRTAESKRDPNRRVFSDRKFKLIEILRQHEVDVGFKIDSLETQKLAVTDLNTRLLMKEGVLIFNQEHIGLLGGVMDLELIIDASEEIPKVLLEARGEGIDPARMPSQRLSDTVEHGFVNLSLKLKSRGDSFAALAASTTGGVEIELFNTVVDARALELVGADITFQILRSVNPFLEKEKNVEFECGLFQADIQDGILTAKNTIAAQSTRISLVGGGVVDLGSEALEVVISPRPRKGFGISASNLGRVVRIGGTLGNPGLEVDPRGLLQSGAKVGAALYTGGLTILAEGLVNRLRGIDNVCEGVRRELRIRAGEIERVDRVSRDAQDTR